MSWHRGPEGRRIAFEIQLAPMTAAVGRERAARHGRDRVESIWLTPDNPQWAMKIPTLAVSSLKPITDVDLQDMRVVRGLYHLAKHANLEPRGGNPPLAGVLVNLLTWDLETHMIVRGDRVTAVIAPTADVATATRHDAAVEQSKGQAPVSVAAAARRSHELRRLGEEI